MRRFSRSISLAAAAGLLALAGYSWFGAEAAGHLVDDAAELMSTAERRRIAEHHAYLLGDHGIDYRVVTARGVGDINAAAADAFAQLAAGSRSATGRGLLLLVDAEADLVRLEVGYALEGVFPDAFVAYVEQRQMVPFFERGRIADGILATTELVVTQAQRAEASAGFATAAPLAGSGGAGATTTARLGAGSAAPEVAAGDRAGIDPGRSPEATLQAYLAAMAARNADPELAIYTPETRRMLRDWVVTPAQMDNVARVGRACTGGTTHIASDARHAVIRYPAGARDCAPYFFASTATGWAIDFATMQRVIRFGRSNAWRLAGRSGHPYAFAFKDWRFDANGFPVAAD